MSVTAILKGAGLAPDYSAINADVLAHASARGTAAHKAIELHAAGDLDESSIHPEIAPYFAAYLKWRAACAFTLIASEPELRSERWGIVGHPDLVGWLGALRVIVDVKTPAVLDVDYVTFQVAGGYRLLWEEQHPTEPIHKFFALRILGDGTYRFVELDRPDALQIFQAAAIVTRAKGSR